MRRLSLCFAAFLACLGGAQAVPARLLYEPPAAVSLAATELRDTVWTGKLFEGECRIHFRADGTLTHGYGPGPDTTPGSWRLEGVNLFFEINKYSEYHAVVQGNLITGQGRNKAGQRCRPVLTRVR